MAKKINIQLSNKFPQMMDDLLWLNECCQSIKKRKSISPTMEEICKHFYEELNDLIKDLKQLAKAEGEHFLSPAEKQMIRDLKIDLLSFCSEDFQKAL